MVRFFYAAALAALISVPAMAEHITLSKTGGFGALKQFYSIGNDAQPTAVIDLTESTSYTSVYLTIDGKQYSSPTGGGSSLTNSNIVCTATDGTKVTLNATFSKTTHLVRVGRGQHYVTNWTLESGSIDR